MKKGLVLKMYIERMAGFFQEKDEKGKSVGLKMYIEDCHYIMGIV